MHVAVSTTDTVLLFWFVTYTFVPSGLTATPVGSFPTFTVATTVFVAVLTTDTVLLPLFVIYAHDVEVGNNCVGVGFGVSVEVDDGGGDIGIV